MPWAEIYWSDIFRIFGKAMETSLLLIDTLEFTLILREIELF
jgi:hypothetical protein